MKNIEMRTFCFLLLTVLTLQFSCQIPYRAKDVFEKKAELPKDEAPHFKNSLEWWYFTGHLEDTAKKKTFGIEYVVFHFNPTNVKGGWMINMAVSDPENQLFYDDHKFFTKNKWQFHELPLNFNWNRKGIKSALKGQNGNYQIKASMSNNPVTYELKTNPTKEVVLHNEVGYENYGNYAKAGYYTFPRLKTAGNLSINGENYSVQGNLWYDRPWNCSGVMDRKVAWDWFSIQFTETNSDLMLYRLYHLKTTEELFGGTYIDSLGNQVDLKSEEIIIEEIEHWESPKSKTTYPVKWSIKIPSLNIETRVEALFPNQELELKFSSFSKFYYWEGMSLAKGKIGGKNVEGKAYVEMTNRFRQKGE